MSSRDLSLAMRLYADATRFVAGLTQAESGVRRFGSTARREFEAFKGALGSVEGKLASLGVSVGAVATIMQSAKMDKTLTQIGQTAGMSATEVAQLRRELFSMAGQTGQAVDDLQVGFNNAVQSGLKFREALPVLDATNKAMAVTGANADILTAGLTVAGTAFQFDLAKPKLALSLLDKMTVAGRLGNAELQSLSSIFGRVGVNAASAGMGFDQTLAFIESLSLIERQPERLATLADSTLRLFTNLNYAKEAAQATGVKFFDSSTGARRDPIAVLRDIKTQYDKLGTDRERALYVQKAFAKADLDTIKGMRTLLTGDMLDKVGEFSKTIKDASGTIEKNLPDAIANSVDQVGRLKAEMRNAADGFVKPLNETLSNWIKYALDKKENGGLGLDGKDMIAGGAAGVLGTLAAARYGGKGIGALMQRFGSKAAGLAEGKALEAAAGITPVFVVNWPPSMGGGDILPGGAGKAGRLAPLLAGASLPIAVGSASAFSFYKAYEASGRLNESFVRMDKEKSESNARRAEIDKRLMGYGGTALVTATKNYDMQQLNQILRGIDHAEKTKVGGEIRVKVDQDGRVASVHAISSNANIPMRVDAGMTMVAP